jgi:myo-inositol-1(or 4)-monophosphatase
MSDLKQLLMLAEKAARVAGEILVQERKRLSAVDFQDASDVKLAADRESESRIRELLGQGSSYPIYGEEEGGDQGLTGRYDPYWVVDPLDGTHNYLRGVPSCCVSIGLMRGETPILGVIYDFNRDECFSGIVAEGIWLNGIPIQPQWAPNRQQASLQTGFPAGMDKNAEVLEKFVRQVQSYKKVRMIGSAALALAYVASGRFDVYFEASIRLWDVAAGLALVQAAGGVVRMSRCDPEKTLAYDVWAAGNSKLMLELP